MIGFTAWPKNPQRDKDSEEAENMKDQDSAFNQWQFTSEKCVEEYGKCGNCYQYEGQMVGFWNV